MSEYTHNDDVADLLYAKEQEIAELQKKLDYVLAELDRLTATLKYVRAELDRLEKEHARGL